MSSSSESTRDHPPTDTQRDESTIIDESKTVEEPSAAPPLPDEPLPEKEEEKKEDAQIDGPPLPDEPVPGTDGEPPLPSEEPPLPTEPVPEAATSTTENAEDGWNYRWDYVAQRYIFYNTITGAEQFENPREQAGSSTEASSSAATKPTDATPSEPAIMGYNPAIHGDYDPNAWYAKLHEPSQPAAPEVVPDIDAAYDMHQAAFNRFTGKFQKAGEDPTRHSADSKANRQLNSFFDVEAAANAHKGKSLKAERQSKKLSRNEVKQFKEKRKARKEEKRRAWLMD